MPRRRSRAEVWDAAHQTAERLHDQDEKAAAVAERERTQGTTLPLEQILDRETDTRPMKSQHVTQLAESLAVLGLLEPLVVDNRGRLKEGCITKHFGDSIQLSEENRASLPKNR